MPLRQLCWFFHCELLVNPCPPRHRYAATAAWGNRSAGHGCVQCPDLWNFDDSRTSCPQLRWPVSTESRLNPAFIRIRLHPGRRHLRRWRWKAFVCCLQFRGLGQTETHTANTLLKIDENSTSACKCRLYSLYMHALPYTAFTCSCPLHCIALSLHPYMHQCINALNICMIIYVCILMIFIYLYRWQIYRLHSIKFLSYLGSKSII